MNQNYDDDLIYQPKIFSSISLWKKILFHNSIGNLHGWNLHNPVQTSTHPIT